MAWLDAELVAYLIERSQVSFLVHHRRPASKGGKKALLTSNPNCPAGAERAAVRAGTVYFKIGLTRSDFLIISMILLNLSHELA